MNRHIERKILGYLGAFITTIGIATAAPDIAALRRELNAGGFIVQEGRFGFLDIEKCKDAPTCAGNNPSSPYGFLYLPPAPGEVRERACDPLGQTAGSPALCANYRLRPDEAVLLIGTTPGESKYFSLCGYLFGRYDARSQQMKTLFASLGDAINQLKISTAGTPNGAAGNPFNQKTAIISTADRGIDLAVRRALEKAGIPRPIMNTLPIPSTRPLRMGVEKQADEFGFLFRAAEFSREADRERFLKSPDMVVLRVTPIRPAARLPYPDPGYQAHGTGTSETELVPGLKVAQEALVKRVIAANPELRSKRLLTIPMTFLKGDECTEKGYNCLGDNQDTTYTSGALGEVLSDDPRDFVMVIGVNHHALAKASYVNLSVYHLEKLLGVTAVTQDRLYGSAGAYGSGSPLLYAYKVARNCDGDPNCMTIPEDFPGVPAGKPISLIERAYLEAETGVAPRYDELVLPVFLRFQP